MGPKKADNRRSAQLTDPKIYSGGLFNSCI